jgi:putative endonuclease
MKAGKLQFRPRNTPRNKCFEKYTFDEVKARLEQYLAGEVAIGEFPRPAAKAQKRPAPAIAHDTLLVSIAAISRRIIQKFISGQSPHPERMRLWERSLLILDELVEKGILPPGSEFTFAKDGYVFRAVRYVSELDGDIVVPLAPPRFDGGAPDDMPELLPEGAASIEKTRARKIILDYAVKPYKPEKWSYVYIVRCADGTLYTGWTNELLARVHTHNLGQGAKYTKSRRPVQLVYWEVFGDKIDAMKREYQIKRYPRKQKLALIDAEQQGAQLPSSG